MSSATLLAVLAATGITYDWQPVDDAAQPAKSTFADTEMVPLRREVARPTFAADQPVQHSVYQQTYPPQNNDLYQGFQQYNTAQDPRRSIGSEIAKGTEKLIDGTGKVIRNTGEAIEGTAQNLRDGFRSVVTPGYNQQSSSAQQYAAQQQPAGATPTGGYQPYSYNQPINAAPTYNAQQGSTTQPGYPPLGSTTAGQPTPTGVPTQYSNQQNGLPAADAAPNWNSTATQQPTANYGSNANPQQPAGYNQQQYTGQQQYAGQQPYAGQPSGNQPYGGGNDAFVDLVNPRGGSANDSMVNLRKNESPALNSTADYRSQNYQNTPSYNQASSQQQPSQPGYNNTPNYNTTASDSFDDWPNPPTNYNNTSPNGAQNYGAGQQQTNYASNSQNGADPSGWGQPIDSQQPPATQPVNNAGYQNQQPGAMNNTVGTQPVPTTNTWFPLVLVAAIGSIAWNFYLGMNYIDARNKYRAALRRSGKAYAEAFDDV